MRKIFICIYLVLFTFAYPQRVGLVLSGGGARGIAHVGLIQALEENEIPIDYITGTSIGAIVGSLYAMGYSPDDMMRLFCSEEFLETINGKLTKKRNSFFVKRAPTPEFFNFNFTRKDSSSSLSPIIPVSVYNPIPIDYEFLRLYAPANAICGNNYDNLFVPFRCIASDIYNKHEVVFRSGDLGRAVRASMTFPLLFQPVNINGSLMFDGGIYNNFPADVMRREFKPDIIIGSVVADNPRKPKGNDLVLMIENMVTHKTNYSIPKEEGYMIRFKFRDISLMDFDKAEMLYLAGYTKGMEYADTLRKAMDRRVSKTELDIKRLQFKTLLPEFRVGSILFEGISDQQRFNLLSDIGDISESPLTEEKTRNLYKRLIFNDAVDITNSVSSYNDSLNSFELKIDTKIRETFTASIGGFISSMNANSLFGEGEMKLFRRHSYNFNVGGHYGNSYKSVYAGAQVNLRNKLPMYIRGEYLLQNTRYFESDKIWDLNSDLYYISQNESYATVSLGIPILKYWQKIELSSGFGYLKDYYLPNTVTETIYRTTNSSNYRLWKVSFLLTANTLNNKMYPNAGYKSNLNIDFYWGRQHHIDRVDEPLTEYSEDVNWGSINNDMEIYFPIGRNFSLGWKSKVTLTNKDLYKSYMATLVQAPTFAPTPHSKIAFIPELRSLQFLAGGLLPIVKFSEKFNLRNECYLFWPFRPIKRDINGDAMYGKWFSSHSWLWSSTIVYNFPFASIGAFATQYDFSSHSWHFGVNVGFLLRAPKFYN